MTKKEQAETEKSTEQSEKKRLPQSEEGEMLHELREAYEKARIDLKQTSDKLRSELRKIDLEEAGDKAKTWIKENPGLAFLLAVGAGMLAGRALTKIMEPPPPPTLAERARQKSGYLADSARHFAGDAVDRLSSHAAATGEHLADQVRTAKDLMYDRAGNISELINKRAEDLSATASQKTSALISSFSDAAERAADSLQVAARDLSKSIKKKNRSSLNLYDALTHAAKTAIGAMVFKRLSDWIRARY